MKILLVPYWIEQAVVSTGSGLDSLLDPKKLLNIASKEDVAFYIFVNEYFASNLSTNDSTIIPKDIVSTFGMATSALQVAIAEALKDSDGETTEAGVIYHGAMDEYYLKLNATEDRAVFNREIMSDLLGCLVDGEKTPTWSFDVKALNSEVIALIPRETETQQPTAELYEELLRILCGTMAFPDVAKTPLFRGFVRLCR